MADKEKDLNRSNFSCSHDTNSDFRKRDFTDQNSGRSRSGSNAEVEDLGTPPMGWMPRDLIMSLVQQLDAELKNTKTV